MAVAELERVACNAASAAADILSGALRADAGVHSADGRDIKTQADLDANAVILESLSGIGLPVLSEESGASDRFSLEGQCWIIDPLDGTMNFVRGLPIACVSVALWDKGQPQFGVIHDVFSGEVWTGGSGQLACCNGEPVTVGTAGRPDAAILATGFPRARDYSTDAMGSSLQRFSDYKKVRMIGAAAVSLAWTAAGRMDLYLEEGIFLWDVAAGLAIMEGAGGAIRWSTPDSDWKCTVVAGNAELVEHEAGRMSCFS